MFFSNVVSTVTRVANALESGSDAHILDTAAALIAEAPADAQRMAQPRRRRDKGFENRPPQASPVAGEVGNARPHLHSLQTAVLVHNRETALEHAQKVVAALEARVEQA